MENIICSSSTPVAPLANEGESTMEELRRGPWTVEEDLILINYIHNHGEGRWNSLARCSGLKRTGKSCRLRWLNYLRPDVRRGNITPEEQLLILELHSRFGNRWSKIAQHLPGRTDNEIKNYWRTRVQKHAKQLQCDVNSKKFKDVMRYLWVPRLLERIRAASASAPGSPHPLPAASSPAGANHRPPEHSPESSDSLAVDQLRGGEINSGRGDQIFREGVGPAGPHEGAESPGGYCDLAVMGFEQWGDLGCNLWNVEDIWF